MYIYVYVYIHAYRHLALLAAQGRAPSADAAAHLISELSRALDQQSHKVLSLLDLPVQKYLLC